MLKGRLRFMKRSRICKLIAAGIVIGEVTLYWIMLMRFLARTYDVSKILTEENVCKATGTMWKTKTKKTALGFGWKRLNHKWTLAID